MVSFEPYAVIFDIGRAEMIHPLDVLSRSQENDPDLTPPSSNSGDRFEQETLTLQVGQTYIIRSVSCGRQITLLGGEVVLQQPACLGSPYWTCLDVDGWLGFRNVASGNLLRHGGEHPALRCTDRELNEWERIQIRPHEAHPLAYTLLMEHYGGLKPVGTVMEHGAERLDRLYDQGAQGLPWIFLKVSSSRPLRGT